jgi:glycosyltransferase involved in cell wall biosynthesis
VKLSILVTYHNERAWLTECLQSLLPQLGDDDEVIVYDDASEHAAQPHLVNDTRIHLMGGSTNIGPARARNELCAASSGTHIHFHDADDLFASAWRAEVTAAFERERPDVVFTDVASFDDAGNQSRHVMGIERLQVDGDLLKFSLRGAVLAPAGTYTRSLVQQVGGYRPHLWQSEDYDFHIRMALLKPNFAVINQDLVLIRRHPNQRSRLVREVWSSAMESLNLVAPRIPAAAHPHAAYAATRAGSALFACGARTDAARAFALADRFGGVSYERSGMQRLTRLLGPVSAERVAAMYRTVVPNALRSRLQRLG